MGSMPRNLAWAQEELERRSYSHDVETLLDELLLLDAPCPPMLARALGYRGHRRFLAVYRTPDGTPRIADGERDVEVDARAYVTLMGTRGINLPDTFYAEELDTIRAVLLDLEQFVVYHGSRRAIEYIVSVQPSDDSFSPAPEPLEGEHDWRGRLGMTDVDDLLRWLADPTDYDDCF